MKLPKIFKRVADMDVVLKRRDFLLDSPVFRNQKYISTKVARRMIEKLFEKEI